MRPKNYKYVTKLPYDLYCPSVNVSDVQYVCTYCKKICTTKQLLSLHLKATQHHSYENLDDSDDEQEPESISDVDSLPNVDDGPCLINNMEKFMQSTFEVDYE